MERDIGAIKCPVCGNENAGLIEASEAYTAPFGPTVKYSKQYSTCPRCNLEADLSKPDAFSNAVKESERQSIPMMLDHLNSQHYSFARIERSLDLPERLISNWKQKKTHTKSGMALLRILRSFPWIIDVADKNFDQNEIDYRNHCLGFQSPLYVGPNASAAIVAGFPVTDELMTVISSAGSNFQNSQFKLSGAAA